VLDFQGWRHKETFLYVTVMPPDFQKTHIGSNPLYLLIKPVLIKMSYHFRKLLGLNARDANRGFFLTNTIGVRFVPSAV
jgi:hypothetical protein